MILTISGRRRHGKDELAKRIQKRCGVSIIHFADHLKAMVAQVFGYSMADLNCTEKKEETIAPVQMDDYIGGMEAATGLKLTSTGLVAHTRRKVLQYFGTDYVRRADDLYWVNRTMATAHALGDVIIADGRFVNECEHTQKHAGRVANIFRFGMDMADDHVSEKIPEIYDYQFKVPFEGLDRVEEAAAMLSCLFPVKH